MKKAKQTIKRIYHDYRNWECFNNGMYNERKKDEREPYIEKAIYLLTNLEELKKEMIKSTIEWKYSTENFMTIKGSNRQAWLGQAACNIAYKVTESEVREAWGLMQDEEREQANLVADEVINIWERKYLDEKANR